MTAWDFLHTHPWWGLVYLLSVCLTLVFIMAGVTERGRRSRLRASTVRVISEPEDPRGDPEDTHQGKPLH